MTSGSLGIRSASYGSLQQQFPVAALSIQSSPVARKPPKMSLPGAREKERFLSRICKLAGRRKVGMLLLLVASVAVFLSFASLVSKGAQLPLPRRRSLGITIPCNLTTASDDDASAGAHTGVSFSDHVRKIVRGDAAVAVGPPAVLVNKTLPPSDELQHDVLVLPPTVVLEHHPCENFTLPPPPNEPKRTGPRPCPVCYAPVELATALMPASPSPSPVLKHLSYVYAENLVPNESSQGSLFGGYPSLQQRSESYDIKESMTVHCGFVRGKKPGQGTGFDIDDAALMEMEQCHGVVVASAIFGNYDIIQHPKNISEASKRTACFYMFVDEETEAYIKNTTTLDSTNRVGLWRVVVVRNLPFVDARRNGKVPKLLLHRLFPNAKFSLWIDGKLELVVDPYQVLERFLWRQNASFAISRHYKRFDVFVEAEANKAAGKYDNSSIDYQIEFYKGEGLTPYSPAKLPITSDVPEGCVIIREHTPITNLFTCLWFNEVDRFTSRDQLSFSTVRDKIMSKVNWTVNMFLDCERRNFVVQAYHRDILEQKKALAHLVIPTPHLPTNEIELPGPGRVNAEPERVARALPRKPPARRGRDRRSGSKRRHPRASGGKDN